MNERIEQEVELLKKTYPDMDWRADALWARLPSYALPPGIWKQELVQLAFQLPEQLPGQAPYGFWVHPGLELANGQPIDQYSYPVSTPFGDSWGQFSWQPEQWQPGSTVHAGTNMLDYVRSFSERLRQGA